LDPESFTASLTIIYTLLSVAVNSETCHIALTANVVIVPVRPIRCITHHSQVDSDAISSSNYLYYCCT